MSGRIRSIKPELLEDAITAGLTETAFRMFIGCILMADDYGNFRAELEYIRGQVFWKRSPAGDLRDARDELAELVQTDEGEEQGPLIQFYSVRGQLYGHVRNWDKHQKISHIGQPRVPGVDQAVHGYKQALRKHSGASPEALLPDQGSPIMEKDQEKDHGPPITPERVGGAEVVPAESGVHALAAPSQISELPERGAGDPSLPERRQIPKNVANLERNVWIAAYQRGVSATLGRPWGFEDRLQFSTLVDAIQAHCADWGRPAAWITEMVPAFVSAVEAADAAQAHSNFQPRGFLNWLNAGQKVVRWSPRSTARMVQEAPIEAESCWRPEFVGKDGQRDEWGPSPQAPTALPGVRKAAAG